MSAQQHLEPESGSNPSRRHHKEKPDSLSGVVKTLTGALIGTALISLFGLVILAFVVKAFITSEEMSFQLLHSAITLVSTSLGAALGYFLGRNSSDKPEGGS